VSNLTTPKAEITENAPKEMAYVVNWKQSLPLTSISWPMGTLKTHNYLSICSHPTSIDEANAFSIQTTEK
jgi:hypothetical protein